MDRPADVQTKNPVSRIEISLQRIGQLFNTMDPSPFHEKDLDADAEEFILSWAQEFHARTPLVLVIHVNEAQDEKTTDPMVEHAIQHYFSYRAGLSRLEFRRLMKDGRHSLMIGLAFLSVCLAASELLASRSTAQSVIREGLTIAGWVAMWRPLEIYLYDWWPVRRLMKIFEKMSRMKVEVHRGK